MNERLLLVDDDSGVRRSLVGLLEGEGYRVSSASDGQEALDLVAAAPVDLVLLDLNMPRKNGWDTFERLTTENPLLPVIIITARSGQLFTALAGGVGALLEKPLDIPSLLRTIKDLLAEPAQQRLARVTGRPGRFSYHPPAGSAPLPVPTPGGRRD
jgi:CheY-like chemotaxis protein